MSAEQRTIFRVLQAVRQELGVVGKDGYNEQQRFSFRGVDAIVNALGPVTAKHGLHISPRTLERRDVSRVTEKGKAMNVCLIHMEYTFTDLDGDSDTVDMWGEGSDLGDKATSKAESMAYKYALVQALQIPTGDVDSDAHSEEAGAAQAVPPARDPEHDAAVRRVLNRAKDSGIFTVVANGAIPKAELEADYHGRYGEHLAAATISDLDRYADDLDAVKGLPGGVDREPEAGAENRSEPPSNLPKQTVANMLLGEAIAATDKQGVALARGRATSRRVLGILVEFEGQQINLSEALALLSHRLEEAAVPA